MSEKTQKSRLGHWCRWLARQVEHVLALAGIGFAFYHVCFHVSRNTSGSMSPTIRGTSLKNGDWILTERVSYKFRTPRRWEVATIRREDGTLVMKRVVGLPGERIQILRGGRVLIDGEPIHTPPSLSFIKYLPCGNVHMDKVCECHDGYYVLGDDSKDSDDSRFNGPVRHEDIVGRTWAIVAPRARFGFVSR